MATAVLCPIETLFCLSFSPLMERRRAWVQRIAVSYGCGDNKLEIEASLRR